jgi:Ca2+-binding EF-hand superfamily protein
MRRIAGLLVATTHLGFANHALAQAPAKGSHSAKRAAALGNGSQAKRVQALGSGSPPKVADVAPKNRFAHADQDHDGSVTFGEVATVVHESLARRIAKRFMQLDRNHDGRCTRAEVNKMTLTRFQRFDLDRNGYFTASELAVVMKRELASRLEQAYVRLDIDRDGRFSVAELPSVRIPSAPAVVASKPREVANLGSGSVH